MPGPSPTDRRSGDRRKQSRWRVLVRENWYRDVILAIIMALNLAFWLAFSHESHSRQDQTCKLFERNAIDAAQQLRTTYSYLAGLKPTDLRSPLNITVLSQLRATEHRAKAVQAPDYCVPKDVGLPDPPPKMPRRPAAVSRLLTLLPPPATH